MTGWCSVICAGEDEEAVSNVQGNLAQVASHTVVVESNIFGGVEW
jgi:hypothetical protein